MHEEFSPPEPALGYGRDAVAPGIQIAHFSIVHKRVSLDKVEQMRFDVNADDAVRFDYCASLAVNVVPWPTCLRAQPAFQRSQQIGEPFAVDVWRLDGFKPWS